MTAEGLVRSAYVRVEWLFAALTDPRRAERSILLALLGYLAAWSVYAAIAKSSQDIHPDMAEMAAWSQAVLLGTPKHPPLAVWLVRGWFSVFPREDWAYYLFAMLFPTVALWITWRLSADYLPNDKRVVGIALLTLVPFYNFQALKFNANTVLTPFWAATTWWFLRSFTTRRLAWAILAGIGAALTMLGKYWSVTLLAGLGIAALSDQRRDLYFRSPAPYVTLAAATILITPHVDWLIANNFLPFRYAIEAHPATMATDAISILEFIGASISYVAVPGVLAAYAAQPDPKAMSDMLWPVDRDRRMLVLAFICPFLFAALIAVVFRAEIQTLWAMSMLTLLPIVALSSPCITVPRPAAVRIVGLAVLFPVVMIFLSPFVAIYVHREGLPNYESDYRLIGEAITRLWRAQTDKPLRIVGSYSNIANGAVFYIPGRPLTFNIINPMETPWIDDAIIRQIGMAMVCPEQMVTCVPMMRAFAEHYGAAASDHFTVERTYLGIAGRRERYDAMIVLPEPRS